MPGRSTQSLGVMERHRDNGPVYLVSAPEACWGTVMGEISQRGGLIVYISDERGGKVIHARIPESEIVLFEAWLNTTAGVSGRVTLAEASNDHDA